MKKIIALLLMPLFCFGNEYVQVQKGGIASSYPIVGTLKAAKYSKIGTQVSGRVKEIFVDVGDRVKKGDTLIKLDTLFLDKEIKKLQAVLAMSEAGLEEAEKQYLRMKNLFEKNPPTVSEKSFDDASILLKQRRAAKEQVLADLENAKTKLDEMTIIAPFDGLIVKRLVDLGESVTTMPAVTVVEMVEDETLHLEFSLPQDLSAKVQEGADVSIYEEDSHSPIQAVVEKISSYVDENTRTFICKAVVKNSDKKLRAGSFVKGEVKQVRNSEVLRAPKEAFFKEKGSWFVKVKKNETILVKPVVIGSVSEKEIEIISGLEGSEELLILK